VVRSNRLLLAAAAATMVSTTSLPAMAGSISNLVTAPRLTTEHVDIGIGYSAAGGWDLHIHDDDNQVEYEPDEALLYVGPAALFARPAASTFNFVGVGAGQNIYRLPTSQNVALLYLGIGGDEIEPGSFDFINPAVASKGRVSGSQRFVRLELVSVTGYQGGAAPGTFSVWQNDVGGPIVFMSSFNDGVANPDGAGLDTTDGITPDDSLWVIEGSHLHFDYGFSAEGIYEVTFRASGFQGGNLVSSDLATYTFGVNAIPEPGVATAGVTLLGGLLGRRRRR
jgi:surface-anchored protein